MELKGVEDCYEKECELKRKNDASDVVSKLVRIKKKSQVDENGNVDEVKSDSMHF